MSDQPMTEYGSDGIDTVMVGSTAAGTDGLGMGVIRKEIELNPDERKYLMAVERGDVPTVQQCLRQAKVCLKTFLFIQYYCKNNCYWPSTNFKRTKLIVLKSDIGLCFARADFVRC
jgi:hypothetical protein